MAHITEGNLPIFVYGTLKRGMCREPAWPHPPLQVETAYAAGRLFDLGAYPAMTTGPHWIQGELWSFQAEHLVKTLATIDAIEGFQGRDQDLYKRVVVPCWPARPDRQNPALSARHLTGDPAISAYTYHYADDLTHAAEIDPDAAGICLWTPRVNR